MSNSEYLLRTTREKRLTKLKSVLVSRKIKPMELAKLADLENSQVSIIVSGLQTDMLLSTAKKICNAIGSDLDETFGDGKQDFKTRLEAYIDNELQNQEL